MNDSPSEETGTEDMGRPASPDKGPTLGSRLLLALRVIQVRFRFVAVLAAAFLIVGLWGHLRNVWDTLAHRWGGPHHVQQGVSGDTEFFCPMDPGVLSDWPAICPVCNMDLVRRKKGEAVLLPEGVVARMQFSPYRIQLAGIKTTVIVRQNLSRDIVVAGRLMELPAAHLKEPADTAAVTASDEALVLECDVFASDLTLLGPGRVAQVSVEGLSGLKPISGRIVAPEGAPDAAADRRRANVRIRLDQTPAGLRPGMFCTARVAVPLAETEPFASSSMASTATEGPAGFLAVPATAIVDTGSRRVVFVETMTGMFDGVEVTLGPRCGDYYPVLAGLDPGQKVAAVGAFLIDAEARLSPNLAAGYFGASRTADSSAPGAAPASTTIDKPLTRRSKKSTAVKLSAADQQLVKNQKICPVTGAALDSMGGPVPVDVAGQRVFICCKGCEKALKADPQKYLAKLKR